MKELTLARLVVEPAALPEIERNVIMFPVGIPSGCAGDFRKRGGAVLVMNVILNTNVQVAIILTTVTMHVILNRAANEKKKRNKKYERS